MAELAKKSLGNVVGKYFVDRACIDCDLCRQLAPKFFKRLHGKTGSYSVISRQPVSLAEERQCQSAMDSCPVDAIGTTQVSELIAA